MTKEQIKEKFFWYVRKTFRNQTEAAEHYGVSRALISAIIKPERTQAPNKQMLKDMGYKKTTSYVRIK